MLTLISNTANVCQFLSCTPIISIEVMQHDTYTHTMACVDYAKSKLMYILCAYILPYMYLCKCCPLSFFSSFNSNNRIVWLFLVYLA